MTQHYAEHWQLRKPAVRGDRGVVATQHHVASEVGAQVLRSGGNAIDAAVSAGLAIGAVEPWNERHRRGRIHDRLPRRRRRGARRRVRHAGAARSEAGGLSPRRGDDRRGHVQLARGGGGRERRGSAGRGDAGLRQGRGARARDLRDAFLGTGHRAGLRARGSGPAARLVRGAPDRVACASARPVRRDAPRLPRRWPAAGGADRRLRRNAAARQPGVDLSPVADVRSRGLLPRRARSRYRGGPGGGRVPNPARGSRGLRRRPCGTARTALPRRAGRGPGAHDGGPEPDARARSDRRPPVSGYGARSRRDGRIHRGAAQRLRLPHRAHRRGRRGRAANSHQPPLRGRRRRATWSRSPRP